MNWVRLVLVCWVLGFLVASVSAQDSVKVFVLAGQSNMEGKAPNQLFEHQATDEKTKKLFAHLRKDGQWIERDDVFIRYLNRHGKLTLGYGSRNRTGVELELGTVLGDHFEEPVLLIKAAWGGHSLYKLFRSPSAGMPSDEFLQQQLSQAVKRVENRNKKNNRNDPLPTMEDVKRDYGKSYRAMMKEVQDTRENLVTLFPELKGKKFDLAGFVWFQGWNDQYNGAEKEYASNMKHFIDDVRKDLSSPKLPFVIGVMGQNGSKPAKGAMLAIQEAQLSMQEIEAFQGNVLAVRTDELADKAAEELFPTWRENFEAWQKVGGDRPYHYLGSAIWFTRIGHNMGDALLEIIGNQK